MKRSCFAQRGVEDRWKVCLDFRMSSKLGKPALADMPAPLTTTIFLLDLKSWLTSENLLKVEQAGLRES